MVSLNSTWSRCNSSFCLAKTDEQHEGHDLVIHGSIQWPPVQYENRFLAVAVPVQHVSINGGSFKKEPMDGDLFVVNLENRTARPIGTDARFSRGAFSFWGEGLYFVEMDLNYSGRLLRFDLASSEIEVVAENFTNLYTIHRGWVIGDMQWNGSYSIYAWNITMGEVVDVLGFNEESLVSRDDTHLGRGFQFFSSEQLFILVNHRGAGFTLYRIDLNMESVEAVFHRPVFWSARADMVNGFLAWQERTWGRYGANTGITIYVHDTASGSTAEVAPGAARELIPQWLGSNLYYEKDDYSGFERTLKTINISQHYDEFFNEHRNGEYVGSQSVSSLDHMESWGFEDGFLWRYNRGKLTRELVGGPLGSS